MIIIILNLGFGTSKNIDHRGKENCTYKSDRISLFHDSLLRDSTNCTKFLGFFIYFTATEKKKIILEEKQKVKRKMLN